MFSKVWLFDILYVKIRLKNIISISITITLALAQFLTLYTLYTVHNACCLIFTHTIFGQPFDFDLNGSQGQKNKQWNIYRIAPTLIYLCWHSYAKSTKLALTANEYEYAHTLIHTQIQIIIMRGKQGEAEKHKWNASSKKSTLIEYLENKKINFFQN